MNRTLQEQLLTIDLILNCSLITQSQLQSVIEQTRQMPSLNLPCFKRINIRKLVENVILMMMPVANYHNVTITLHDQTSEKSDFLVDKLFVQQVLLVLISNAVKFSMEY